MLIGHLDQDCVNNPGLGHHIVMDWFSVDLVYLDLGCLCSNSSVYGTTEGRVFVRGFPPSGFASMLSKRDSAGKLGFLTSNIEHRTFNIERRSMEGHAPSSP